MPENFLELSVAAEAAGFDCIWSAESWGSDAFSPLAYIAGHTDRIKLATGVVQLVRFVAVDDFGHIINPMIVDGQVHGGITQGIGQAMLENAVYDKNGQLLTASYMDYCMPRADDVPSYNLSTHVTPCPGNPLGIKGCGEAGAIGSPPALMNAVTDAIGNNNLNMPATPSRVWAALNAKH